MHLEISKEMTQLQLITELKFQKSEPISVMANTKRKTLDYT